MTVRVKICGITNGADAAAAVAAGADALGFVFYPKSPRFITPEAAREIIAALPPFVQAVGLFVNEPADAVARIVSLSGIDLIQLHGDERPDYCCNFPRRVLKALRVKDRDSLSTLDEYEVAGILLDAWSPAAYGGTGETFNWDVAAEVAATRHIVLAGGLTPQNVAEAVRRVRPYAVDVSSGVESAPGIKDHTKVAEFIRQAKGW